MIMGERLERKGWNTPRENYAALLREYVAMTQLPRKERTEAKTRIRELAEAAATSFVGLERGSWIATAQSAQRDALKGIDSHASKLWITTMVGREMASAQTRIQRKGK